MPGLSLGSALGGQGFVGTAPSPNGATSVTQAAYGPGATVKASGSVSSLLNPGKSHGLAFWLGVGGIGWLLVVHHSLPR